MGDFKNQIINECINLLNKDEVKSKIKDLMRPLIDMIIQDIYPYIFLSIVLVFTSFLLILGIFILLIRNYKKII